MGYIWKKNHISQHRPRSFTFVARRTLRDSCSSIKLDNFIYHIICRAVSKTQMEDERGRRGEGPQEKTSLFRDTHRNEQ